MNEGGNTFVHDDDSIWLENEDSFSSYFFSFDFLT